MMERILVVFQAAEAKTENQALAFGLGAVEGGANIRLRHLAGGTPAALEHQGYGQIKDVDIEWAQAIGLAIEAPQPADELTAFLDRIKDYKKTKDPSGKLVYVFGHASRTQAIDLAENTLQAAGFSLVDPKIVSLSDDLEHLKSAGKKLAGAGSQ